MLLTVAWRNIWRNKARSLVIMIAIALGLWAGAFLMAYAFGVAKQRIQDAIASEISHIQIHHPEFEKEMLPIYTIPNGDGISEELHADSLVAGVSPRVIAAGMVGSANNSLGGQFVGITPEEEDKVTGLSTKIIEGTYFEGVKRNPILLGEKLANKLKVKERSKVVLTFQDVNGEIVAGAFRVVGIYRTHNTTFDEMNLFVRAEDLNSLLGSKGHHQMAILLKDVNNLKQVKSGLISNHSDALIEDWKEVAPELGLIIDSFDQYMDIFIGIILLTLSFGIVNTMLMAVLERVKEIGMLMAVGMNKTRIFSMIFLETLFIVMFAAPLGLLLAMATIYYTGNVGLDLSAVSDAYASFGFKSRIYPELEFYYYMRIMVLVVIAAILSSIYPAITALRLNPVEAIRKL
ncbi:MAG: FtsX-like permease family protein [Bacteroidota bacterium]